MTTLPFDLETDLERLIASDPHWLDGIRWGAPRPGHPEGSVGAHIREVLANVDRYATSDDDRERLRLVAIVHDSLKHRVDPRRQAVGDNHHARLARRFAGEYLTDGELLEVIELHDDAWAAWKRGARHGDRRAAERAAGSLIDRLGPTLPFFLRFYRCDNETGDKTQAPLAWFEELAMVRVALPVR